MAHVRVQTIIFSSPSHKWSWNRSPLRNTWRVVNVLTSTGPQENSTTGVCGICNKASSLDDLWSIHQRAIKLNKHTAKGTTTGSF